MHTHSLLSAQHFHAVDTATLRQTLAESQLEYSIDMGGFTVHHGTRYGAPIVIAENHGDVADALHGVWFDDNQ
ncbi:hypothetical protein ACXZ1M_20475 [Duganella sp. PWIR1]